MPYGYSDDKFFDVTLDPTGTRITASKEVSPEKAVPSLIEDWIAGDIAEYTGAPTPGTEVREPSADAHFADGVIIPAYDQIMARPGLSDSQKNALLKRVLGVNTDLVRLATEALGEERARGIWGNLVDLALRNDRPPDEPTDAPAKVIQRSRTQGQGPPPPSPPANAGDLTGSGEIPTGRGADGAVKIGDATGDPNAGGTRDSGGQGTSTSPRSDTRTGGDPLLLASGQLYFQVTDLQVAGRGLTFSLTRTYLNRTLYKGPLGYSWDHAYNLWLREAQEVQPDGALENAVYRSTGQLREDRYTLITDAPTSDLEPLSEFQDGEFRGPPGFFDRLELSGGRYTLQMVNGVRIEYGDDLLATRIVDLNRNALTLQWTEGRLTLVTDPVGKRFSFQYDPMNRVSEVVDETGERSVRYFYDDNGDLAEVDLVLGDGQVVNTDYLYSGPNALPDLEHNLTEVRGPDGESQLECGYGEDPDEWHFNRVVEQRSRDGRFVYDYRPAEDALVDPAIDPVNVARTVTSVRYPNGHVIEHWFNRQGNVLRRVEEILRPTGLEQLVADFHYNAEGLLVSETHPDRSVVEYRYDVDNYEEVQGVGSAPSAPQAERLSFGNLLRRVEHPRPGLGEDRVIVTEFTYEPAGNRTASQRGPYYADGLLHMLPGQAVGGVRYEYDSHGNLSRLRYPGARRPDGSTQTLAELRFEYDSNGSLSDVRNGSLRTHYGYFADKLRSGFIQERVEDADGIARRTTYESDALGRTTGEVSPLGGDTEIEWTSFDTIARVKLPSLRGDGRPSITYSYDRSRRVVRTEEDLVLPGGTAHPDRALVQTFEYDHNGRLRSSAAGPLATPEQRVTRTIYSPTGRPIRTVDPRGTATVMRYDERDLLVETRLAPGTPDTTGQRLRYNRSAELVTTIDSLGRETVTERDAFGRQRLVRDRDGNEWETEYDATDRATVRRLRGRHPRTGARVLWSECLQEYDEVGRIIRRTDRRFTPGSAAPADDLVTTYWYDDLSRLVEVRDGATAIVRSDYDGLGRLIRAGDADGNEQRWIFDDAANRVESIQTEVGTGAAAVRQLFRSISTYDERGLPIQQVDGLGNTVRYQYDSRGLAVKIEPDGRAAVTYEYDAFGQLTRQRTTAGGTAAVCTREYDPGGLPTAIVTPVGGRIQWTHDVLGRMASASTPAGHSAFEYDAESNLAVTRDDNGVVVRRTYSGEGQPLSQTVDVTAYAPHVAPPNYAPGPAPPVQFDYTPAGALATADDGRMPVEIDYDSLGRPESESTGGRTTRYAYDAAGRMTGLQFPSGRRIAYDHSGAGMLTGIRQTAAGTGYPGDPGAADVRTLLSIERIGPRPLNATAPGVATYRYAYDAGRRLTSIDIDSPAGGGALWSERILHGARGERAIQQINGNARSYEYDTMLRLVGASDRAGQPIADVSSLAPATSDAELGTAPTQSDIDALVATVRTAMSAGALNREFKYELDSNGNRLSTRTRLVSGGPLQTVAYKPDTSDRYMSVGGSPFAYDDQGNLLDDGTRRYRYDGFGRLTEVSSSAGTTQAERDALGRLTALDGPSGRNELSYAHDHLIEWIAPGGDRAQIVPFDRPNQVAHLAYEGADAYPVLDDFDSLRGWVSTSGAISGRRAYDPFGRPLAGSSLGGVPIGFAGYLRDPDHGLYWLQARVYDPRIGRFLQPDPLGIADGLNVYAFARNAPGTLTDYFGFSSTEINWWTVGWEATKTLAIGLVMVGAAAAAVAAGIISAPFVLTVGGLALVGMGLYSFFKRADEAFAAGQTDFTGRAALAAAGDVVGATNVYEGASGHDAVSDRMLYSQERSERLGTGIGTAATFVFGGKAGRLGKNMGTPADPASLYSVWSISRPTYRNPLVLGTYTSPQGVVWEANVFRGALRATGESWRSPRPFFEAFPEAFRGNRAGGSFWHVRSHFADMPTRTSAHGYFDPSLRPHMVLLGDAPLNAARGVPLEVGPLRIPPENTYNLRDVWRGAAPNPARGTGYYLFNEVPYPEMGRMGGNPTPNQLAGQINMFPAVEPRGAPLSNGFRVIVGHNGAPAVKIVTMYPE